MTMINLGASLEIARRALRSHQFAMNVIGSNIANASTPGYSRRRVMLQSTADIPTLQGGIGTGVRVQEVSRVRDGMLDRLYRDHQGSSGRWAGLAESLARVEGGLMEPGGGGLRDALGAFWSAWQDLANDPESTTVRLQVRERGKQLNAAFQSLSTHLTAVEQEVDAKIRDQVERVNQIAERLATINRGIVSNELQGVEASGLRDERDLLLDELSEVVDLQVREADDGAVTVYVGSQVLVQKGESRTLSLAADTSGKPGNGTVLWSGTAQEVAPGGGLLAGYLEARNERIAAYREDLDALARALVTEVNQVHRNGYGLNGATGVDFFDPSVTGAGDMRLGAAIEADVDNIAASRSGAEGDGGAALDLAALADRAVLGGGRETFEAFLGRFTGQVGFDVQQANTFLESEDNTLLDIENQRQGISGVSIDEEMTMMLSAQHAFEAMIRVTRTLDEMTDTLLRAI